MKLWRNIKDFILSYTYPKGQYFLVSFPKTGRTWLLHMINQMKELSIHPLKNQKYFIFNEHDNSEIIIENGFRNNPLSIFRFTGRNRYRRGKVIFLVRDPRDVVVSHYHQVTKRAKNPFKFNSISSFVTDEVIGFNRIIHYYNLWHSNRSVPKEFLLVKYEDLLENGVQELQKINIYLSLKVSVSDIEKVYEESSANKMRKKEIANQLEGFEDFGKKKNQLKVRNAKIGDYVKELSEEDIAYCNEKMKDLNPYFNY
jgi:hypothetical protein